MRIGDIAAFATVREAGLAKLLPSRPRIAVGMGTCGSGNGAEAVYNAFSSEIDARGLAVQLAPVGCFGFCAEEPLVNVWVPGRPLLILHRVQPNHVDDILNGLGSGDLPPADIVLCKIEEWDHLTGHVKYGTGYPDVPNWNEVPFFDGQVKIVLRNCGLINPDDIEEYVAIGGYQALYKVLIDQNPAGVIESIKAAKLRGRGGAGYLTGNKWEFLQKAPGPDKYLVCNADEGDPGAYMNRNEIESDPHALLEGMLIAGFVTGAPKGIIYVRAEYPLAVIRLERAIAQARAYGVLGENVLGRGFDFDIQLVEGAGAFVCGEETALIASLEGHARPAAVAPAVPRAEGPVRQADQHQQRRDLVQRRPDRLAGCGLVHRDGQRQERGHQGLLAGRQGAQHRAGGDAAGHAAGQVHLRHRRRQQRRPRDQGRADGRTVGRLHPGGHVRHAGGLRDARAAGLDHGLGRHGRDGPGQLHGGRRPLLHRVHALGELRQVRPVPRRPRQGPAHAQSLHRGHGRHGGHRHARRAVPHGPRHVAVRAGPERPEPGPHQPPPLPPRVRGPHPREALPRRRVRGPGALAVRELLSAAHEHPALPAAVQGGARRGRVPLGDPGQPAAGVDGARLPAPVRQPLPPGRPGRGREHAGRAPPHRRRGAALGPVRHRRRARACAAARAHRARGRDRGRRPDRPGVRVLPGALRAQRGRVRLPARRRRHAPLRAAGVPPPRRTSWTRRSS